MSYIIYSLEDDKEISRVINLILSKNGNEVISFYDATSFFKTFDSLKPNMVLLDLMLPDMKGEDVLKRIREDKANKDIEIIVLSAKNSIITKVDMLDLGADDYLSKPFHLAELSARIKSVIRRHQHNGKLDIIQGNVRIEPDNFKVFVGNKELELNRKEYDILLYFINRPGRLINKSTLAESVWGDHIDQVDNFDFIYAQIKNLRKKLKESGANIELKAVYGFGYKMIVE